MVQKTNYQSASIQANSSTAAGAAAVFGKAAISAGQDSGRPMGESVSLGWQIRNLQNVPAEQHYAIVQTAVGRILAQAHHSMGDKDVRQALEAMVNNAEVKEVLKTEAGRVLLGRLTYFQSVRPSSDYMGRLAIGIIRQAQ